MANHNKPKLVLVQTRLQPKDAKRLAAAQKLEGSLSQAELVRRLLLQGLKGYDN